MRSWSILVLGVAALALVLSGCKADSSKKARRQANNNNSGSGGSGGTATGGGGSSGGAASFEVIRSDPANNATASQPASITLTFSNPVDPATVQFNPAQIQGSSFLTIEQDPNAANATLFDGRVTTQGAVVQFIPSSGFTPGFIYGVALTDGIRDTSGNRLVTGSVSGQLTLTQAVPGLVFQLVFQVSAAAAGGGGASPGGAPASGTPAALIGGFVPHAGTDVWYLDFDSFGTFDNDLAQRGLGSSDPATHAWARARVIARALSYAAEKYHRNADGSGNAGASLQISFVAQRPAGSAGQSFSRHCIGGNGGGTLGVSIFDPGNQWREDNCSFGQLGVFSSGILGQGSFLNAPLLASDLPYLDGSYQLGQGTAAQDSRFRAVRGALDDYGQSIGLIVAHEVGHSVGLDHDSSSTVNVMYPAASASMMSNPNMRFSQFGLNILSRNLGVTP